MPMSIPFTITFLLCLRSVVLLPREGTVVCFVY